MSQKMEPDLKKIRCIQLATRNTERAVQLSIDQLSKQTIERFPQVQNLICEICKFIPQGDIVECPKCDKIFCSECLDQWQYQEIKKKKAAGDRDINPNNEAVQKMECPKFHIFYGYTSLDYRERDAYGLPHGLQPPKPRKKLNQHVQSLLLEQLEFVHMCRICQPINLFKAGEEPDKAGASAPEQPQPPAKGKGKKGQTAAEEGGAKSKNNKRLTKQQEKEKEQESKKEQELKDASSKEPRLVTLKYKDHIEHMKKYGCQNDDIRFKCPYECPHSVDNNLTFTSEELTNHLINDCQFTPMRCAICKKSLKGLTRKDKIRNHNNNQCIEHIKASLQQRERKIQEIKNHNNKIEEGINAQNQSRRPHQLRQLTNDITNIKQMVSHEDDNLRNQLNSQVQNLQRYIKPYIVNTRNKSKIQKTLDPVDSEVKGGLSKYDIEVPDNWTEGDYEYDTSNEEEKQAEDGAQDEENQILSR